MGECEVDTVLPNRRHPLLSCQWEQALPCCLLWGGGGFGGKSKVPSSSTSAFAWCELANYDARQPPIFVAFLTEGRSMVKVEVVLHKFF